MRDDERPDPDALLSAIEESENRKNQGNLRVFLGMSAGVGKTYAMLRAAHQKLKEGADVIVGVVETHGRAETVALTEGLPTIQKRAVDYRGTQLKEMDLEAILARKPELVIVDELAHTNIPGSRHEKRYQDVLELLDAGIDVFTAFNVQHLDSRKDAVEAITGIPIRETVPDSVLEKANQVELVDISPSELLKRLKEGKVYLGDKAERATQNFFKEDKLTALREIALRMTAERVDQDLQKFVRIRPEGAPWQTSERLLVAISHSPYSEKLIRATRRLAYSLEAPWIAVHVDTGIRLNDLDQAQLVKNISLAKELNAELIATTEIDVPTALRRICRQKNVTQVIVGRPTRRWFRDIIEGGSLLQRLVRESLEVDIHIIRHEGVSLKRPKLIDEISYYRSKTGAEKYWNSLWGVIIVSMFGAALDPFIGYRSVGFVYLMGVICIGIFGSISSVALAALLSALIWDFIFIPPKYTFYITNSEDILMCVSFFAVAMITGFLTNRLRNSEKIIREREERTNVLYSILQDIAGATDKSEFLQKAIDRVGRILDGRCGIILKSTKDELEFNEVKSYSIELSEKEKAVAQWSFDKDKPAGWSTDTLAETKSLFLPLKGSRETVGIFVYQPTNQVRKIDIDKENLIASIVRQLGVSVERHFLAKRLVEAQRLKDSEELHQTLLNSISHEMRTPLTAILGSLSTLENESVWQEKPTMRNMIAGLQESGDRLNRVIENLLDMSRLNSGALSLKLDWHDVNDMVGVVVKKLQKPLSRHQIKIKYLDHLLLAKVDFRLMEHAISNVLINATMYSPENSTINISVTQGDKHYYISITDEGSGIPQDSLSKVFDKFYRVPGSPPGGTGLGLSIVKSIVEFHKGKVRVENVEPHGARFNLILPLAEQPQLPKEGLNG